MLWTIKCIALINKYQPVKFDKPDFVQKVVNRIYVVEAPVVFLISKTKLHVYYGRKHLLQCVVT